MKSTRTYTLITDNYDEYDEYEEYDDYDDYDKHLTNHFIKDSPLGQ